MIYAAILAAGGFFAGILDWRRGLLLCLIVGFAQDPLRKITPGRPVAFVVLVGVVFVGCIIGFLMQQGTRGIERFFKWYPGLRAPIAFFVAVILFQCLMTIVTTGNPVLAALGLLSYLSPLFALFLGQTYATTLQRVGHWQKVYLCGAVAVGASILLAFRGFQSPLFASIGNETVYGRGGRVEMVTGLMRSSEISSWHAATAACLVIVWSVARRHTRAFWLGMFTTLALLLAVLLTGRRKTLAEVLIFVLVFGLLLLRTRSGASRLAQIAMGLAVIAAIYSASLQATPENRLNPYFERSRSVVTDAPERFRGMAIGSVYWALVTNGPLGRGAGTGAQGAQHFGGGADLVGYAAEGGLGRIAAELGVPGLIAVAWLTWAVGARLWRLAAYMPRASPAQAPRFLGLLALIPANIAVFTTAHTLFGDPFVLIVMGFIASSVLAFPQIAEREKRQRQAALQQKPALRPALVTAVFPA